MCWVKQKLSHYNEYTYAPATNNVNYVMWQSLVLQLVTIKLLQSMWFTILLMPLIYQYEISKWDSPLNVIKRYKCPFYIEFAILLV